jgi:hypothetical protein
MIIPMLRLHPAIHPRSEIAGTLLPHLATNKLDWQHSWHGTMASVLLKGVKATSHSIPRLTALQYCNRSDSLILDVCLLCLANPLQVSAAVLERRADRPYSARA